MALQMHPDELMSTFEFGSKRLGTKAWNIQIHKGRRQRTQCTQQQQEQVCVHNPACSAATRPCSLYLAVAGCAILIWAPKQVRSLWSPLVATSNQNPQV